MKYGSRKFLLALLTIISADALRFLSMLDGGQWVTIVAGTLTVYFAANVGQKAVVKPDAP